MSLPQPAAKSDGAGFDKGLTVGALVLSGTILMGADGDTVQRAIVFIFAVVLALLYGTFDASVFCHGLASLSC